MLLPTKRQLAVTVLLLCTSIGLAAAQKKSSTPAKKAAAETPEAAQPIAVHEFSAAGVEVALMEVTRTSPEGATVKWEYRNKTAKPQLVAAYLEGLTDPDAL